MKNLLFLDFDGVIFDTIQEAYVISNKVYSSSEIEINYTLFKNYRYLIGPAWNYKYLIDAILNSKQDTICDHYLKNIQSVQKSDYEEFEGKFFEYRSWLKKHDFLNWNSNNKPYPFFYELVKFQKNSFDTIIISTKDKETILEILNSHKIITISPSSIYGHLAFEKYGTKSELIKNLMLKKKSSNAIFIDDMYSHLKKCNSIENLKLIQADWGYCDPNENSEYKRNITEVLFEIKNH